MNNEHVVKHQNQVTITINWRSYLYKSIYIYLPLNKRYSNWFSISIFCWCNNQQLPRLVFTWRIKQQIKEFPRQIDTHYWVKKNCLKIINNNKRTIKRIIKRKGILNSYTLLFLILSLSLSFSLYILLSIYFSLRSVTVYQSNQIKSIQIVTVYLEITVTLNS